tara:strand:+ start:588 stop:770 length:183 start_codon:yes stop_codon:yes gene_type:complete
MLTRANQKSSEHQQTINPACGEYSERINKNNFGFFKVFYCEHLNLIKVFATLKKNPDQLM